MFISRVKTNNIMKKMNILLPLNAWNIKMKLQKKGRKVPIKKEGNWTILRSMFVMFKHASYLGINTIKEICYWGNF